MFVQKFLVPVLCFLFLPLSFGETSFEKNDLKYNEDKYAVSKVIFEDQDTCVTEDNQKDVQKVLSETELTKTVVFELNNSVPFEDEKSDKGVSLEESKTALRNHRQKIKEYYSKTNSEFLSKMNLEALDASCYISNYAPFIFAECEEITSEGLTTIIDIAESDYISCVYIKSNTVPEEDLTDALSAINANRYVNNSSSNGAGVVIGILDAGIADKDNANFNGCSLTVRKEWWYFETISEHATMVASIAGGNTGVARGASLLSVEVSGEPSGEVEWMLDRDVNIINTSYGSTSNYGKYTSEAAYMDNIVRNNWVTIVGSAGNRGDEEDQMITSPKTGFNYFTIGSCDNSGNISDYSSFQENFNISKPNIVAPGELYIIPNTDGKAHSGTSFASPITAGTAAVLMQQEPILMQYPEHVISIISASTTPLVNTTTKDSSGLDDRGGAGMLNMTNAMNCIGRRYSFSITDNSKVKTNVATRSIYLSQGQIIRACFVTLKNDSKSGNYDLTDYDLRLYRNGSVVASSTSSYNNVEFIDYEASVAGTYELVVYQYGEKKTSYTDYCSLTYNLI